MKKARLHSDILGWPANKDQRKRSKVLKRFNMKKARLHSDILGWLASKDAEEEIESFECAIGKNLGTELWQ